MSNSRAIADSIEDDSGVRRTPLAPAFVLPFASGDVVGGKYEIAGLIGIGGVGYVVSAVHRELRDRVALKFLHPTFVAKPEVVSRFEHEARAAARIKSAHVARVFDIGHVPVHGPFIVMELLEGCDLGQLVEQHGALPQERAVLYTLEAAEGLAAAHADHIIHRDVKPDNLFLARQRSAVETVKLLDFGISKTALGAVALEPRVSLTRGAETVGSPPYMSPEQIRGVPDIDPRTDIWSLGCVLYELLSGRQAFEADSLMQVCAVVLEHEPAPLRTLDPNIPPELEAVVLRCLQKDREQRFQTVGELAQALAKFAAKRAPEIAQRCRELADAAIGSLHAPAHEPVPAPPRARRAGAVTVLSAARRAELARLAGLWARSAIGRVALLAAVVALIVVGKLWLAQPAASRAHGVSRAATPPPSSVAGSARSAAAEPPSSQVGRDSHVVPAAAIDVAELAAEVTPAPAQTSLPATAHAKTPRARKRRAALRAVRQELPRAVAAAEAEPMANAAPPAMLNPYQQVAPESAGSLEPESTALPATTQPNDADDALIAALANAPVREVAAQAPSETASASSARLRAVTTAVRAHAGEIQQCFERAKMEHADLHGEIVLHATLDRAGKVTTTATSIEVDDGSRLAACIRAAAQRWQFPVPVNGVGTNVSYKFVFE